jgi:iron complex outermembrane receptor protein
MRRVYGLVMVGLVGSAPFGVPYALAQNAVSTSDGPSSAGGQLEEIVVTAQRREESAQKVPIAVTQYSADSLKVLGVTGTADLPLAIPGFQLAPTGAGQAFYLRGVGNNSTNPGVDSEVSTYVDGVYMPFQNGDLQNFNNIASLEVDKGPQGTLFGRNATGGVVQINTKDPSFTPTLDAEVGYGNYDTYTGSIYGAMGVTDKLAGDLAVYINDQNTGWGTDLVTGESIFKTYDLGIRTKWLYQVSDATTIRFTADYDENQGSSGTDVKPASGSSTIFNEITGKKIVISGPYNVDANYAPSYDVKQEGASIKVNTDFGWAQFASISAYRQEQSSLSIDYDGTPIDFIDLIIDTRDAALNQEFQLLSPKESSVNWVAGLFYYNETGQNLPFGFGGPAGSIVFGAPTGDAFDILADETTKSYAVYGQANKEILPATRLTLGYRFTVDDRSIHGATFAGPNVVPGSAGENSSRFTKSTYRFSLDHDLAKDVLVYASYNRGYHAGTFNLNSTGGFSLAANPPVNPEVIDAYETGIKSEWLDHKLRVNASGFWYKYTNLQQQEYQGAALVTVNAAAARIRGIDLDIAAQPIDNLTLSAAVEFLDARFTSYPAAPIYAVDEASGALISSAGNAGGKRMPFAPVVSGNVSANYKLVTPVGNFSTAATLAYNGGFYGDPGNGYFESPYYLLNMSETWSSANGRYDVGIWGKNLADKYYDASINPLSPVAYVGNPGAPRTFGIRFGVHM